MPPVLYIVIPCYNEEKVLPKTAPLFFQTLNSFVQNKSVSDQSRILFVNDGSNDRTWHIIEEMHRSMPLITGISLSRNRGHQNALLAGLMEARFYCDISISIDCDGQDDINAMESMIEAYNHGSDIVYGVRSDRHTDSFLKRSSAQSFYRFLNIMGIESIYNHADYRLLSKKVLDALADYHEVNLYLRGMIPLIGFNSTCVYYERQERTAGESHYSLAKMVGLALDGVTSLSIRPIRFIIGFGLLIALFSIIGILWSIITKLFGYTVQGWTSLICIICFISGVQLISLGVIGEYVGKIYLETKARPRYIISDRIETCLDHTDAQLSDGPATETKSYSREDLENE
ncbi:MAG: glycosyltransferase family 2 protein [Lachnospiraceae bacterium]|nr:glycosyltransferase family 2 protein [Lachnospiraceae bacterium]